MYMYLHSEEGDTCEEVHCGLEVLQPLRTAGRKVILRWKEIHTYTRLHIYCPVCLWARSKVLK